MSESLKKISAMSLFVEDLTATKAFYRDVFGVSVVFEDEVSAVVQFDNLLINLLQITEAPDLIAPTTVAGADTGSRFQLSIWVDDVASVIADLQARGVEILSGPIDREWGMRTITFNDPAGHNWEVAQSLDK